MIPGSVSVLFCLNYSTKNLAVHHLENYLDAFLVIYSQEFKRTIHIQHEFDSHDF